MGAVLNMGGANGQRKEAVFIDWLTITQHHQGGGLPILVNGIIVWHDRCGNVRHERASAAFVGGSFSTAIRVGCDGARVYVSGNVGRFSRADNLFNFGWEGTVAGANRILLGLGLPPFTGARGVPGTPGRSEGARVHRLDLTVNFASGSEAQARAVIRWLAAQSVSRVKRGVAGDESVWWANTRSMFKAYLKGAEMVKHGKSSDEFIVDWCNRHGVVRVEVELKRRLLAELGLQDFDAISDERLAAVYREQTEIMRRVDRSDEPDILAVIPARYRIVAAAWMAGQDVRSLMSERTMYRYAKVLRDYGIDILSARNVSSMPVRVRVVELEPLAVPDWYDLKLA